MEYSFFAASGARLFGRVNVNTAAMRVSVGFPPPRRKPPRPLARPAARRTHESSSPRARCPVRRERERDPADPPALAPILPPPPSPTTRRRTSPPLRRPAAPPDRSPPSPRVASSIAGASERAAAPRGDAATRSRGGWLSAAASASSTSATTSASKSHPSRRFTCAKKSFISPSSATAARLSWLNATVTPRCISWRIASMRSRMAFALTSAAPSRVVFWRSSRRSSEVVPRSASSSAHRAPSACATRPRRPSPALEREVVPSFASSLFLRAELSSLAERVHDHDVRHAARARPIGAIAGPSQGTVWAGRSSKALNLPETRNARQTLARPLPPRHSDGALRPRRRDAPAGGSRRRPRSRAPPRASPRPRRRVHSRRRTRAASSRSAIAGDGASRTRPGDARASPSSPRTRRGGCTRRAA